MHFFAGRRGDFCTRKGFWIPFKALPEKHLPWIAVPN